MDRDQIRRDFTKEFCITGDWYSSLSKFDLPANVGLELLRDSLIHYRYHMENSVRQPDYWAHEIYEKTIAAK